MKNFKTIFNLGLFVWIYLGSSFCFSEIPFEDSYASKFWTKESYDMILQGNAYWSKDPNKAIGRESVAAQAFIRELCSTNRPNLENYAKQDIDQNPIAVLWSEFFLAREGSMGELRLPKYFKHLFLVSATLDQHLKNKEDHLLLSKLFLDAVRRLHREQFLQKYYDEGQQAYYKQLWSWDLTTHLTRMVENDPDYVHEFLRELLLLQNDLSAWYWDRDFAKILVTEYATNAFKDSLNAKIIQSNSDGTITQTLEPREYEEITSIPAMSMLRLYKLKKELIPFYQSLSQEVVEKYYVQTRGVLEALAAYKDVSFCNTNWILATLDHMEPSIKGTMDWLSVQIPKEVDNRNTVPAGAQIKISDETRTFYVEMGLPLTGELSTADVEKLRNALLTDKYCLNYYAIKALQGLPNSSFDSEFWSKWVTLLERQIWIRNCYERFVGVFGQDRLCKSYETDGSRFLVLLDNVDIMRFQLKK